MRLSHLTAWVGLITAIAGFAHTAGAQQIPKVDRETAEIMLKVIAATVGNIITIPKCMA